MTQSPLDLRQTRARTWFETLRDEICAAFEALEDALPPAAPLGQMAAGRFRRTLWQRTDHTGAPGGGGLLLCHPANESGSDPGVHSSPRR